MEDNMVLKKVKIELSYDPAVPLLGIHLEKTITLYCLNHQECLQKDTSTPMVHGSTIYNSQDTEAT